MCVASRLRYRALFEFLGASLERQYAAGIAATRDCKSAFSYGVSEHSDDVPIRSRGVHVVEYSGLVLQFPEGIGSTGNSANSRK